MTFFKAWKQKCPGFFIKFWHFLGIVWPKCFIKSHKNNLKGFFSWSCMTQCTISLAFAGQTVKKLILLNLIRKNIWKRHGWALYSRTLIFRWFGLFKLSHLLVIKCFIWKNHDFCQKKSDQNMLVNFWIAFLMK